jgi:SAM-dependent methyltransferase
MRRNLTVLDLGYGTGFPLLELAERLGGSCKVFGVDPWEAARQRAEGKARLWQVRNVELLPGDAAALPFPDATFDLIVSNLGINNFADPQAAFHECYRSAKPGAQLALTTNLQGHMREFYDVYESTLRELGRDELIQALHAHIAHRASVAGVTGLFERAGFRLRVVNQQEILLRFIDGSAFLRHHLIRQGFLDAWKNLLAPAEQPAVFARLEANLNQMAEKQGELALSIPMAYFEGEKLEWKET